jgi:hypothetical protein
MYPHVSLLSYHIKAFPKEYIPDLITSVLPYSLRGSGRPNTPNEQMRNILTLFISTSYISNGFTLDAIHDAKETRIREPKRTSP